MAQLLPVDLLNPQDEGDLAVVGTDQSIQYGRSWEWVFPPCENCSRDWPHLEVIDHRVARTSGVETLEQWIRFAMVTERYAHPIFSTDFGVEFRSLVERGASIDEAETEIPRMIREALAVDPRISQVRKVNVVAVDGDTAEVEVEVLTFSADVSRISLIAHIEEAL